MSGHLLSDLYQIKMMYAHWVHGTHLRPVTFDLYFRTPPHEASGAIVAGVQEAVRWVLDLRFDEEEIAYLRQVDAQTAAFDPAFWDEVIRPFRFTGSIDGMPDGTRVFASEPILRVTAPIYQAQYIESHLLEKINSLTLIASKADLVVRAAGGDPVIEMGLRRAQGDDASVDGAKAAYQAGVTATATIEAGKRYGIPVAGTTAHAWFQFFGNDLEAMRAWARAYDDLVFVLDTYDTLHSGLPGAMQVARETGKNLKGVRIDSGDLAYLSKHLRAALDAGGFGHTQIMATSDLDEHIIESLKLQGAPINSWGVGTQLITGGKQSALGGVYKLSAVGRALAEAADPVEAAVWEPRIKLSENPAKVTLPGRKQVFRIYQDGMMAGDLVALDEEPLPNDREPITLMDPLHPWKRKVLERFTARPLLEPLVRNGQVVHPELSDPRTAMEAARARTRAENRALRCEYLRLLNPDEYLVALSDGLFYLRRRLIEEQTRTRR